MAKENTSNDLVYIQTNLKAPKNQRNNFGGYNYRSCEDIMEAVKPLLKERGCSLTVGDDIVEIGDRVYVKATAILRTSDGKEITNTAFAREPLSKKGSDESQITGAASSYARKYALNGLFCIDDTKDADATNDHKDNGDSVYQEIARCRTEDEIKAIWYKYPAMQSDAKFTGALRDRKNQLSNNGKS